MRIEDRKHIFDVLDGIQNKYDTSLLLYKGVNIWFIIRISTFFYTIDLNKERRSSFSIGYYLKSFFRLFYLDYFVSLVYKLFFKFPEVTNFYSSHPMYRVMFNDFSINRFLDPLLDISEEKGLTSCLFESDETNPGLKKYKEWRVHCVKYFIPYFEKAYRKKRFRSKNVLFFDSILDEIQIELGYDRANYGRVVINMIDQVFIWRNLWTEILLKCRVKNVYVLCYYDARMLGLVLAANDLKLKSFDIQHGGQGEYHIAYNFKNQRYFDSRLMPTCFLTWDIFSASNINKYFLDAVDKAAFFSNPWIDFLKRSYNNFDVFGKKNGIVYTLQPLEGPILTDYILEAIENSSSDFCWCIRLHPKMGNDIAEELKRILNNNLTIEKVFIDKGNDYPLPFLLSKAFLHLTHFSGSVIEANLISVPYNVVIGELGAHFYSDLVVKGEVMVYYPDQEVKLSEFLNRIKVS